MKVIVTIPAFNEEQTILKVIRDIKEVLEQNKYNYELLVINDGSTDNTVKVSEEAGAKVISHNRNMGLAQAFRTEVRECLKRKADIIVHTDADGQYQAKDIPILIKEVQNGADLVLGSRFKGGIEYMPSLKKLGNKAFSKVISKITGYKISDCQTGFRAFTKEVAENVPITSFHTYTQEQIIRTLRLNYKIVEVPTFFARRGGGGKSRLMKNPLEYAIKAWINLLRVYRDYEPLKFFGMIGSLFLSIGLLCGVYLLYNFIQTGIVGHLPLTILSVLFILLGIQIVIFGFLADMLKK